MIKFENTEVVGWEAAIRGMRNPMNSWEKSDSWFQIYRDDRNGVCSVHNLSYDYQTLDVMDDKDLYYDGIRIGPNDQDLMMRLAKAGSEHAKYRRMIVVYVDITAPLYWWKEFDTYKVGTVANSCSTMHKIAEKEFTLEDFSCENLGQWAKENILGCVINGLNIYRSRFLENTNKNCWWHMIQLLPSSYNQRRTVMMNYEVLAGIYHQRQGHKLDEWRIGFMKWIESLPYSEIITGKEQVFKEAGEEAGMSAMAPAT